MVHPVFPVMGMAGPMLWRGQCFENTSEPLYEKFKTLRGGISGFILLAADPTASQVSRLTRNTLNRLSAS